jgi:ParB-like chromosome segregation protein Spo0J
VPKSKPSEIKIDPEFRSLIPPLSPDERDGLRKLLREDGCIDSIKLWRDKIVDGHNRYELCNELKIKFNVFNMEFPDRDAAKEWIINNQFGRRNLTSMARAELALKLEPLIAAKAKANQKEHGGTHPGRKSLPQKSAEVSPIETREEVAKLAGISRDTIAKVKTILAEGTPEAKERLRAGESSIHKEYLGIKPKAIPSTPSPPPEPEAPASAPPVSNPRDSPIEELYNFGKRVRVSIKIPAENAMRARNAVSKEAA